MSTTGTVTAEYPLNGATTPDYILQGVDGNFYFTDTLGNKMGQFLPRSHKTRSTRFRLQIRDRRR